MSVVGGLKKDCMPKETFMSISAHASSLHALSSNSYHIVNVMFDAARL